MDQKYLDIINYPHYEPKRHPRMPMSGRAAQFAPFAALGNLDPASADIDNQKNIDNQKK